MMILKMTVGMDFLVCVVLVHANMQQCILLLHDRDCCKYSIPSHCNIAFFHKKKHPVGDTTCALSIVEAFYDSMRKSDAKCNNDGDDNVFFECLLFYATVTAAGLSCLFVDVVFKYFIGLGNCVR